MHNNTNYQCKICWNKALTFGVGSIQLSFRIYHCVHPIHANMFSIQMLLHFSQIVPRVCTLVLSFFQFYLSSSAQILIYIYILYRSQHNMWSDVIIQLCKLYSYVNTGGVYRHTLESGGLERICRGKSF